MFTSILLPSVAGASLDADPFTGPARADDLVVQLVSGESIGASTLDLQGETLQISGAAGERSVEIERVVTVLGTADRSAGAVATDCTVILRDGSELVGSLRSGEDDLVRIRVPGLGDLDLPIEGVHAVAIGDAESRSDPSAWAPRGDEDLLFRRGGVAGDFVAGTVLRVGSDGVAIENDDLGELTLPALDVVGVVIADLDGEGEMERGPVEVELVGGSRVVGRILGLSTGTVSLATLFAPKLEIRMDAVQRVRFQSTLFRWLSDLEPVEVEETPFIGGPEDFLFGWRRDHSVTGEPLVVAGRRFGKGLGLHSRSRLTFLLSGSDKRFRAYVGVSDEVLDHALRGDLVVRFLVDGEVRFESDPLRAGEAAVPVDIDIQGAKRLVVVVDFGDRGDIGDRAVIGDPMLLDS